MENFIFAVGSVIAFLIYLFGGWAILGSIEESKGKTAANIVGSIWAIPIILALLWAIVS